MVEFFDGGDAGQGKPDNVTGYKGGAELNTALENGTRRRYGRHGYAITINVSQDALLVLRDYADTLEAINLQGQGDDRQSGELSAARTTMQRIDTAVLGQ
jgi:hypothetical protein